MAFDSATTTGSNCRSATVTLDSVSLFGGAVTVTSVRATDGKGTATGLEINGAAVAAAAGETVAVAGWGQLTLGARVGRVTAPLVLRLLQTHDALPAGTAVAVGFAASAQPTARPKVREKMSTLPSAAPGSRKRATRTQQARKDQPWPQRHPPDYPAAPSPLTVSGGLTDAARDNPVVSIAMRYLGVPYQWGGASPKSGFDCSGLVMYVFAQLGVPLIHFAAAQWHSPGGVWVAPNRLRPGDLVFFTGSDGTRKEPGHVGIYVDDGYIIDAPHTGTFVRIDSLDEPNLANQYVGARRIDIQPSEVRHLLRAATPAASATGLPLGFPRPLTLAGAPGPVAARTTTDGTASDGHWIWAGGASGVLLFALCAGGFLARRRRPEAATSSEVSN